MLSLVQFYHISVDGQEANNRHDMNYVTHIPLLMQVQRTQTPAEEEEEEEETEELGHVDTYADYKPSKCMLPDTTLKTQYVDLFIWLLFLCFSLCGRNLKFAISNIFL